MVAKVHDDISSEDLNILPKVHNGHSRRLINRSIQSRREMLFVLMAKGYSRVQSANILQISIETACKDVVWLRNYHKQQLLHYVSDELPSQWYSCLEAIHSTMKSINDIIEDPNISTHDRLHAHDLFLNAVTIKQDLLSDPAMISELMQITENLQKRIVPLSNPSANFNSDSSYSSNNYQQGQELCDDDNVENSDSTNIETRNSSTRSQLDTNGQNVDAGIAEQSSSFNATASNAAESDDESDEETEEEDEDDEQEEIEDEGPTTNKTF